MTIRERIIDQYLLDPKFNQTKYSEENGCSRQYVSEVIKSIKDSGGLKGIKKTGANPNDLSGQVAEVIDNIDNLQIITKGKEIRTAEGAMDYCGVNPEEWIIRKKVVNFWDMGENRNWQVKVWLDPINLLSPDKAIERLIERVPKFKYSKFKPAGLSKKNKSENLFVLANFDVHLGKLAWNIETGQGDYDIPITVEDMNNVTDANLEKAIPYNPEKIYYILGQDFMHYENLEGVTPRGRNILDTDSRLDKLQDVAIDLSIHNIMKCRSVAPVEVILVAGNHDETSSSWLAKVLRSHFRNDKYVDIDASPALRKARLWGESFIGLAHQILPSKIAPAHAEFSVQFKDLWCKAEFRDVLFGDQHKKMQWKIGSQITHGGTLFRQVTALSRIDRWHYENLFTDACPGGEGYIFNKSRGCLANFTEWTKPIKN